MEKEYLERLATFAKKGGEIDSLYESGEGGEPKLKEGYFDTVMDWISGEKNRLLGAANDQHRRGKKEGSQAWESFLKKTLGLDTDLIGDELQSEISAKIADMANVPTEKELTEESLAKHPLFEKVFETKAAALRSERDEFKTKLSQIEEQRQFDKEFGVVVENTFEALNKANWKSGATPEEKIARERTIKELITNRIKSGLIKIEDGKPVNYNESGKRLQTDDFVNVNYSDWVVNTLNPFGVNTVDPNNSSPSPNGQNGGNSGGLDVSKMSKTEFGTFLKSVTSSEERGKLIAARLKATRKEA